MAAFALFYDGFLDCALWATTGDDERPLDTTYDIQDIAKETMDALYNECWDFYNANYDDLCEQGGTFEQWGHDFFLTKCGHGTGYWDRGTGAVGERLTTAAKVYGPTDLYVGDDGNLYA
jgi:hypothetical protein